MKFAALTLHVAMAARQLGSGLGRRLSGKLELFSRCLFGRHPTTLPFDLSLSRWPSLLHQHPRSGDEKDQLGPSHLLRTKKSGGARPRQT